jgi:EmrB/QacA subfamily drug resistance transporter
MPLRRRELGATNRDRAFAQRASHMTTRSLSKEYRERAILLVASLAMFLNTVDISILNVAIPVIERDLVVGTRLLQWLQGAYGLFYAGFLLLSGRLADLVGRRSVFLAGVFLFGTASLGGSLAPGFTILLAARGIQGIGAALMVPSAISIISTTFEEGSRRNWALGIFSAVAATGFSSGLVAGALIAELASWRWIFFVNVPITAAILCIAPITLRHGGGRQSTPVDILGAILVTAGLLTIVYAITTIRSTAPASHTLLWSAGGAALLTAFARRERRHPNPLIPLSLFAMPSLRAAGLAAAALLGSAFGFFFLVSMYLQLVAKFSSLEAGLTLLPMSTVSALVSGTVAPRVTGRFGARHMLAAGLVLNAIGIALFVLASPGHAQVTAIAASIILGGLGMGIGYPACNLAALDGIAGEFQGAASGFQNTCLQAGGAVGTALAATALSSFGGDLAALAPGAQACARTLAAIVLALVALLGALLLLVPGGRGHRGQCACPTNP